MKKIVFTLMTVFAIATWADKANAQTALTPYQGGTYSYTMSAIDNVGNTRIARVFIDNDAISSTPNMSVGTLPALYTVTSSTGAVTAGSTYYDIAIPINTTTLNFDIAYDATMTAGEYQLYVVLYDGTATDCYNFIYRNITVTESNFNLAVAAPVPSTCQTINLTPTENNPASASQTTQFTYTVTKTGGDANDDWGFTFTIPDNGLDLSIGKITARTAEITTGVGAGNTVAITGTATSGIYDVKVTNAHATIDASQVTITITVTTTTGVADAAFVATETLAKLYVNQTTTVSLATENDPTPADNTATVTLLNLPSIGTFEGN